MRGAVLTQIDRDAHYLPAFSCVVLTKLRDYDPVKHRAHAANPLTVVRTRKRPGERPSNRCLMP